MGNDATLDWLLEGDPAIRWQAMRDLIGAEDRAIARERAKVARDGWGARLLAAQDPEGTWGGGLYTPKWTSTTYTMLLLRDLGLPAGNRQARAACALLLDRGLCPDGGICYPARNSETCITGMVLSILAHFEHDDERVDTIVEHLLDRQMADGGWNCRLPRGATHASVHTTISVLEGLLLYARGSRRHVDRARSAHRRGLEFLLEHRLFRSHRTGDVINPAFLRMTFPPRWHYDVLRALDHFRDAGAPKDERLGEGIELVRGKRTADGRWPLVGRWAGETHFEMERGGQPSRWNTLRARRVLAWWVG